MINYNMRCIETVNIESSVKKMLGINYNMRCIETKYKYWRGVIIGDKLQHEMY